MRKRTILWMLILGMLLWANSVYANELYTEAAVIDGKTSDRVHLREQASIDAKSLGLYFTGTTVQAEPFHNREWVWLNVGTQRGYIKSEFLQFGANASTVVAKQPVGIITNNNANTWTNLRGDLSLKGDVVKKLYNGDRVTVLGETVTKWYYVSSGGEFGYVMVDFLLIDGSVPNGKPAAAPTPTAPSPSGTAVLDAYIAVLHSNQAFVDATTNQQAHVSQLAGQIPYFAVVDVDGDAIPEVILGETVNGTDAGFMLFHYQSGTVYGYSLRYRAFMDLKEDGTFSFSSGAGDNGFGRMSFHGNAYAMNEQTYCQSSGNGGISYFVNRQVASENAFTTAIDEQARKSDASWYEFSAVSVDVILSGYRWGT